MLPSVNQHIVTISDLIDGWRALGSRKLRSGVELLGRMPVDDEMAWMHVVFPGCSAATLDGIERVIGTALPTSLRAFYRCCGGMSLFLGAFHLCSYRPAGVQVGDAALQPSDIVALNHELDVFGWRPAGAVAFAENSWDASVHLAGMVPGSDKIVRCERATGLVIEEHDNVFQCVADRLYRLDSLLLR